MLIDDVANQIVTKANTLVRERDYRPKLVVYMSQSFHYECMMEIRGEVSSVAMTFLNDNRIFDYPVHRVIGDHPSFRIVEV
jgi:hypothetical protein